MSFGSLKYLGLQPEDYADPMKVRPRRPLTVGGRGRQSLGLQKGRSLGETHK